MYRDGGVELISDCSSCLLYSPQPCYCCCTPIAVEGYWVRWGVHIRRACVVLDIPSMFGITERLDHSNALNHAMYQQQWT